MVKYKICINYRNLIVEVIKHKFILADICTCIKFQKLSELDIWTLVRKTKLCEKKKKEYI